MDKEKVDPRYLAILLRSKYFQRAFAAINTGHSNRRRIQMEDFLELEVFLLDPYIQSNIAERLEQMRKVVDVTSQQHQDLLEQIEEVVLGIRDAMDFLNLEANN